MKILKSYARHIIGIAIIIGIVIYALSNPDVLRTMRAVPPISVIQLVLVHALYHLFLSYGLRVTMGEKGKRIGIIENFFVSVQTNLMGLLFPAKAGTIWRGLYYKARCALPISDYLYVCFVTALLAVGFIVGLPVPVMITDPDIVSEEIRAALLLFCPIIFAVIMILITTQKKLVAFIKKKYGMDQEEVHLIRNRDILVTALCYGVCVLLYILRLYLVYRPLIADFSIAQCTLLSSLLVLISAINLIPGNLGIKEGGFLIAGQLWDHSSFVDLSAGLVDRASHLIFLILFGIPFSFIRKKTTQL